jgi:hypothetical protein
MSKLVDHWETRQICLVFNAPVLGWPVPAVINHSKTKLVQYLDGDCIVSLKWDWSLIKNLSSKIVYEKLIHFFVSFTQ